MPNESELHPNVLVVAHNPLNWNHNNGRTMSALFEPWPKGAVAQIYMPFMTPLAPGSDVCQRYWPITLPGIVRDLVRSSDHRLLLERAEAEQKAPQALSSMSRLSGMSRSRRVLRIVEPLRELIYASPSVFTRPLRRWAEEHRPKAIFTMMGSVYCLRIAVQLAKRLDVPIIPYFSDDWATTLYEDVYFSKLLRRAMNRYLREVLERSPIRLAGGAGLAEEYARRYGGVFVAAPNPADPELYFPEPRPRVHGEPLRLTYIGNMQIERWKSLLAIGEALQYLSTEGTEAQLEIYCPEHDRQEYSDRMAIPTIKLNGFVPPSEIPRVLAQTDMVCLAEAFDDYNARYTRFSFATKISEYAMAGRAVLAVGPSKQTSLEAIAATGCGLHVPDPDPQALANALRPLLGNLQSIDRMGAEARKIGERDYSRTAFRERFGRVIDTVVNGHPWNGC